MRTLLACLVLLSTLLAACSKPTPPAPTYEQLYTVRGVIHSLKVAPDPNSQLQIRHEAIPEFVNGAGETSGMHSMTMPFPTLAPGVSTDTLAVGDKIRFTFGVTWTAGATRRIPEWTITSIEKLPADTTLDFELPPTTP